MVHHTMNTSISKAARASSSNKIMSNFFRLAKRIFIIGGALWVTACAVNTPLPVGPAPGQSSPPPAAVSQPAAPVAAPDASGTRVQGKSRWVPVRWTDLPGFENDTLFEAWNAWIKSCERPGPAFAPLCPEIRRLSIASMEEQRAWMMSRLQPYRVESLSGVADGLLTSYFEPVFRASRQPTAAFAVPLYQPPAGLASRKPWFSRQDIETLPEAQAALQGREIAWLEDPIDAMLLHIQGSGRLRLTEADGRQRTVRVAFAGTNEQPYRSINQWLLEQGVSRNQINPWPDATKAWAAQNPQRVSQLLWSNPRYIFFREEALPEQDTGIGPRGAQGVPLTAGRSIAVDRQSIPYGTPVWMTSSGPSVQLQKLVLAQDTGSAILGAVRADYFAGTGAEAGTLASKVNQPLKLWVLWPR
ncbi:MAG: MltA domain-containing protein [Polaromonas sp.]|nr:MltA domain-containing protein [Polaromonas sp.]